ncbi:MAG: phosphoribosyltransferase [Actinobacteria bacterium]|nr:phosphoribosyltransferase [Actinomycetota bacterium]
MPYVSYSVPSLRSLHAYHSVYSARHDEACRRLLRFKDGCSTAFAQYRAEVARVVPDGCAVAVVPSHSQGLTESAVRRLARAVASEGGRTDATPCLWRTRTISKLSRGGDRRQEVHLESVVVRERHLIEGRRVVLLDDVTTSGGSFLACRDLLLNAGAQSVECLALAKTHSSRTPARTLAHA